MQFLVIFPKLSNPTSWTCLGNSEIWQEKLWTVSTTDNNSNWSQARINLVILQPLFSLLIVFNLKLKNAFELLYIEKRYQISNSTYA